MTAATIIVSATRIPDSPTHSSAPALVLTGSNAAWIMAFQAACSAIAGQTLPVSSRRRANTKLNAVAVTIQSKAATAGGGPTRYTPPRMSGTCHRPQISPLARMGLDTPASIRRVSMYPRQPISSPAAVLTLKTVTMVVATARLITNTTAGEALSPTYGATNPMGSGLN